MPAMIHGAPKRIEVVNLCRRGRRSRLILGLSGFGATAAAAIGMMVCDADPLWRWALLLPVFGSVLCILEAWSSTCVVLATLGAWDRGCGTQRVPDPGLETELRCRAWKIVGLSFVLSALLTTLAFAFGTSR